MTGAPVTATSVGEILDLYERWGPENYDEGLSQLEHALQTAALAVADGAPDEQVAAALLHDIGHLLDLAAAEDNWVPSDIDLDWDRFRQTYERCQMIRSRYTVLDLALETGLLAQLVDELFAPDGFWGRQQH